MEVMCTSSSKNARMVRLPDELVTEILARVPYRSLCRFKCVSRSWRALCSDPAVFHRCPQTLSGFFFHTMSSLDYPPYVCHFVNASGRGTPMVDPSLSFLPPGYTNVGFLDCCNGLLLCNCKRTAPNIHPHPYVSYSYFVCNPATGKWMDLPDPNVREFRVFRLGFDPAVSSHFRVFLLERNVRPLITGDPVTTRVEIFSSETGAWSYRKSEWGDRATVGKGSVFFNRTLHLTSLGSTSLLTVDMDGRAWGEIPTPHCFWFIGVSQGRLHAVQKRNHRRDGETINIWVLEDYAGQQWTLKHSVTVLQMFGARPRTRSWDFDRLIVHAVHPEHGVIFLTTGKQRSLMSYDMDKKKVRFIWTLGESNNLYAHAHPYVPCFSDWLPDGH